MPKCLALIFAFSLSQISFSQTNPPTPEKEISKEKPVDPQPKEDEKKDANKDDSIWTHGHFGLGLTYGAGSKLKFDNISINSGGSTYAATATLTYSDVPGLEVEGRWMKKKSFGFLTGLTFETKRTFKSGTITIGALSISENSNNPSTLQIFLANFNGAYQWETFYLLFGLNCSSANFNPSPGFTGSTDSKGGIGAQFGVGNFFLDHLVGEIMIRLVAVQLTILPSSGGSVDFGTGYLSTLQFGVKYIF